MVPDDLTQAVLARADVARYLRSDRGGIGGRERVFAYLEELRTTQRYQFYRALKHPLYPILRKIERHDENVGIVEAATRTGRVRSVTAACGRQPSGAPRVRARAPCSPPRRAQVCPK